MQVPESCEENCKLQTKLLMAICAILGVKVEDLV
jgi:DNA-binding Xre family transcriptional regulator